MTATTHDDPADAPTCLHGTRVWREAHADGRHYAAWVCAEPLSPDRCAPLWCDW